MTQLTALLSHKVSWGVAILEVELLEYWKILEILGGFIPTPLYLILESNEFK